MKRIFKKGFPFNFFRKDPPTGWMRFNWPNGLEVHIPEDAILTEEAFDRIFMSSNIDTSGISYSYEIVEIEDGADIRVGRAPRFSYDGAGLAEAEAWLREVDEWHRIGKGFSLDGWSIIQFANDVWVKKNKEKS